MWMIKITIKANQIEMDVLLISKVDNVQKPCLSLNSGFFRYFICLWILPEIYRDSSAFGEHAACNGQNSME